MAICIAPQLLWIRIGLAGSRMALISMMIDICGIGTFLP